MKIATHVVLFGQDRWIMKNIENAYPHVERIYIAYSNQPWAYNPNAKNQFSNSFDLDIIRNSPFIDKITIIEGIWSTEEDQRNACVDAAIKDGIDYLIIHDADEFYFHNQFKNAIAEILKNPNYDFYKIGWYCFWKSFKYILLGSDRGSITGYPEFAINLKRGVRFVSKRRPNKQDVFIIKPFSAICYHASYVLTDEEVYQKINTWGHANDFDREKWYRNVWLAWTPKMKNLHLVSPSAWSEAVEFNGELPEVIKDME